MPPRGWRGNPQSRLRGEPFSEEEMARVFPRLSSRRTMRFPLRRLIYLAALLLLAAATYATVRLQRESRRRVSERMALEEELRLADRRTIEGNTPEKTESRRSTPPVPATETKRRDPGNSTRRRRRRGTKRALKNSGSASSPRPPNLVPPRGKGQPGIPASIWALVGNLRRKKSRRSIASIGLCPARPRRMTLILCSESAGMSSSSRRVPERKISTAG